MLQLLCFVSWPFTSNFDSAQYVQMFKFTIVHPLMVEAFVLTQMEWPVQIKLLYRVVWLLMKYLYFSDAPESVKLLSGSSEGGRQQLTAGRMEKLECECRGSRPAPVFTWTVGDRKLDSKSSVITNSVNERSSEKGVNRMVTVTTGTQSHWSRLFLCNSFRQTQFLTVPKP